MGHLGPTHKAYVDLQARLDRMHTGLPEGEGLHDILRILYTEDEARVATRMPLRPMTLRKLARRLAMPEHKLQPLLEHMCDVGTVMDIIHPKLDETLYMLSPPVVGFIEFALMKRREDLDQPALAMAMDAYMSSGALFGVAGAEMTQIGRTLVNEDALPEGLKTEILPYEKATAIIEDAKYIGVSHCYCRHKAEHLGRACEAPMEVCLNINNGFHYVVQHGMARAIDTAEALDVLARSREVGLVQIADNVAHKPIYVCNCCGCCCQQLRSINRYGLPNAVHTSNYLAAIDAAACRGCGRCARRCPIQAIHLDPRPVDGKLKGKMRAVVDEEICLGCGVCHTACRHGHLTMKARPVRVLTPEATMDRVVRMALDRGRLQHMLFDELDGPVQAVANRLLGAVLKLPPTRRALANQQLRSRFVDGVVRRFGGKKPPRSEEQGRA